jgi:hypothetical protein
MRSLTGWRRSRLKMVKTKDGQKVWRSASVSSRPHTRQTSRAYVASPERGDGHVSWPKSPGEWIEAIASSALGVATGLLVAAAIGWILRTFL